MDLSFHLSKVNLRAYPASTPLQLQNGAQALAVSPKGHTLLLPAWLRARACASALSRAQLHAKKHTASTIHERLFCCALRFGRLCKSETSE
eukprot:5171270-Amphidinium_carterae.1